MGGTGHLVRSSHWLLNQFNAVQCSALYDGPERNTRTQVAFKLGHDYKGKTSRFIVLDSIVRESLIVFLRNTI